MNGIIGTWMLCVAASGAAPDWHDNYTAALKAARADRKPLLVVMHNPTQPQQTMKQAGHVEAKSSPLLENYHACEIDVSTEHGKRVAEVFRAKSFPYTVITDSRAQKIIYRNSGSVTDAQWSETLADYRRGSKPIAMAAFSQPASSYSSPAQGGPYFGAPQCTS